MKVWIVFAANSTEPNGKFYLLGAHSTSTAAHKQKQEFADQNGVHAHVEEMEVDGLQPPILVGSPMNDCVKGSGDQSGD